MKRGNNRHVDSYLVASEFWICLFSGKLNLKASLHCAKGADPLLT